VIPRAVPQEVERVRLLLARNKIDEMLHEAMRGKSEKSDVTVSFTRLQRSIGLAEQFSLEEAAKLADGLKWEGFAVQVRPISIRIRWRL
jgi:hypothetical protein